MAAPIHVAFAGDRTPVWADALVSAIADTFPGPVRASTLAMDLAPCLVPDRDQHHAALVLASLLRGRADPAAKVLGVVSVDLFIPVLTFVFGLAPRDGAGAVVSTYRLRTEYYGLPPDEGRLVDRAIKEGVHELGHAFGLVHCDDVACVMHASTSVDEVDLKGPVFCGRCDVALRAGRRR